MRTKLSIGALFILFIFLGATTSPKWTNWSHTGNHEGVEFWVRFKANNNHSSSKGQFKVVNKNAYRVFASIINKRYKLVDGSIDKKPDEGASLKAGKSNTFISDAYCPGLIDQVFFDMKVRKE